MRGIRKSLENDAKDGYVLSGHVFLIVGKEFHKLSFVGAKTSLERVQLTLQT